MLKIITSILLITLGLILPNTASAQDSNYLSAVEVSFDLRIEEDNFKNLKAIPVLGHPMELYLTHPNSLEEYKLEILVSEIFHNNEKVPKLYLEAYNKKQDAWRKVESIETIQLYDTSSKFSIQGNTNNVLSGQATISTYDKPYDSSDIKECNSTNMLSTQSCCTVPCSDGSQNKLKCCGGVGCCGCGLCCQIP
ncbi:MAG: hypothetical protein LC639_03710 [Idiomarina sp.]|nr:hypothetical protein [Idiomarina sp.]